MIRQPQDTIDQSVHVIHGKFRLVLLGEIQQLPNDFLGAPKAVFHVRQIFFLTLGRQRPFPNIIETI